MTTSPIFFEAELFRSEQMTLSLEPSLLAEGEDLGGAEELLLGLGFWADVPDLHQHRINMDMWRFRIFDFLTTNSNFHPFQWLSLCI